MHFNDSTTLVLAADKQWVLSFHFFFYGALMDPPPTTRTLIIYRRTAHRQGTVYVRKNYTVAGYPKI